MDDDIDIAIDCDKTVTKFENIIKAVETEDQNFPTIRKRVMESSAIIKDCKEKLTASMHSSK